MIIKIGRKIKYWYNIKAIMEEKNKKPSKATTALLNKIAKLPKDIAKAPKAKPRTALVKKALPKVSTELVRKVNAIKREKAIGGGEKVKKINALMVGDQSSQDKNYITAQAKTLYDNEKKNVLKADKAKVAKLGENAKRKNVVYDFYRGVNSSK